jgi:hypothetical protein
MVLRATRRAQRFLPALAEGDAPGADTALGDWYVDRLVVGRQPLFLIVSSGSLYPMLAPARDGRHLPDRLPEMVAERLIRLGARPELVRAEVAAMMPVVVGATKSRSVVGSLVDFARTVPYLFADGDFSEAGLAAAEAGLAETPCRASRRLKDVVWPPTRTLELLDARWRAEPSTLH